jgi:hypothetical protein
VGQLRRFNVDSHGAQPVPSRPQRQTIAPPVEPVARPLPAPTPAFSGNAALRISPAADAEDWAEF